MISYLKLLKVALNDINPDERKRSKFCKDHDFEKVAENYDIKTSNIIFDISQY